jgi:general secretion pathway protein L
MSSLILTLPLTPPGISTKYSYTLTSDGHTATDHARAAASLLPEPSRPGGEVVAVVPITALSWQRVQLPPGIPLGPSHQTPRLRSILEGLLEDRLLDDPAQLHFALQPSAEAGSPVWVAVCDRSWLRDNLQALEAAGRAVSRVVPEFAPGPTASGGPEICALGSPSEPQMVLCGQGADQNLTMLPLSVAVLALAGLTPGASEDAATVVVRSDPAVAELAERTLGRQVTLHTASQRALEAARGDWDLAQFELASTSRTRAIRKAGTAASALLYAPQWRAARWAAAVLVAVHVLGLNVWAWQERQALAAKQVAVRSTLTTAFPQVKVVVDAPVQMERELSLLRQKAGSVSPRDLEPLMAAVGASLPDDRVPTAVEYAPGELRVRGVSLAPDEESVFNTRLQAAGYRARTEDGTLLVLTEGAP